MSDHECCFVEEEETDGRKILIPCITCGKPAMEALADAKMKIDKLETENTRLAFAPTREEDRRRVEPVAQDCPLCGSKALSMDGKARCSGNTAVRFCPLSGTCFSLTDWNRLALREE